jgi:hypothetical protein
MTKQKQILLIALLALVSMMIAPVNAEIVLGTLGGTSTGSYSYSTPYSGAGGSYLNHFDINGTENFVGTTTLIRFDVNGPSNYITTAPSLAGMPFILWNAAHTKIVANGTCGFQRSFDDAFPTPNELPGYQWFYFNAWTNTTELSGQESLVWESSNETMNFISPDGVSAYGSTYPNFPLGLGSACLSTGGICAEGDYIRNVFITTYAEYTAVRPSGIGIEGLVTKLHGGTTYSSRAYVFNGTSGAIIGNNPAVDTNDLLFNLLDQPLKIGILDAAGNWYNTSVLFVTGFVPTVTPTPTPTIPGGYVRNNLYVWDQNDAQISGADVDVLDVEAGTWTNTTADADGWITIDTLPYHTVNIYAHYPTANIYLPNEILGLETGYYGGHNWVIVLYPYTTTPAGFVTLYINTRDYDSKAVLTNVNLQIKNLVTGAVTGESTGSTDSVATVVTNATNYQITGSKSGYLSKTININSGEAASKTVVLELSRATASPTPTPTISGQPTAVPTQDENDPILHDGDTSLKAQEMMNWLAMNGMMLVQLCFLVTIFALLGVKLGK